ncbi:hypothetical protein Acsp04_44210 [Actinomadura sp. NBRC 104425]|uniref:hypothetical protein n=1 Tax=Actinomadura sp. NBRC 104425 TaxID=3032204 RepID=UPI0024A50C78|nr:hypothetical protein [Actinomadura sp. NBRC 104425]GLZ14186.1 hypothetical protein Acsp04_44210 [Actinomadura sp. NBRC 104425]
MNAEPRPLAEQWPLLTAPDCPTCQRPADVVFIGPATTCDGTEVNVWHCRTCPADWAIPVTHWPVQDGPDCPYCLTPATCWAAIDPDNAGDLWTCQNGHEFTLTPEGLIILPGDAA